MLASDPFDGLLPPGWTPRPVKHMPDTYDVRDGIGRGVFQCRIDREFPVEVHARYAWWRYTFPEAPPTLYLRFGESPEWLPERLRPGGQKSLEELGSLGG